MRGSVYSRGRQRGWSAQSLEKATRHFDLVMWLCERRMWLVRDVESEWISFGKSYKRCLSLLQSPIPVLCTPCIIID